MHRCTLYLNKTVVVFHNAVHHRKAQAGSPRLFGSEERLKDPVLNAFVHSNAGVTDLDTDVPLRFCFAVFSQALSVDGLGPKQKLAPFGIASRLLTQRFKSAWEISFGSAITGGSSRFNSNVTWIVFGNVSLMNLVSSSITV